MQRLTKVIVCIADSVWSVISSELGGGSGAEKLERASAELEVRFSEMAAEVSPKGLAIDPIELMKAIQGLINAVVLVLNLLGIFRK